MNLCCVTQRRQTREPLAQFLTADYCRTVLQNFDAGLRTVDMTVIHFLNQRKDKVYFWLDTSMRGEGKAWVSCDPSNVLQRTKRFSQGKINAGCTIYVSTLVCYCGVDGPVADIVQIKKKVYK